MLLGFGDARERSGDKGSLEVFRGDQRRIAGGDGEHIDQLQDEETGKGTAKIGDAMVASATKVRRKGSNEKRQDVRSKESHIGASNRWVGYLGMECRDGNEHDRISES